MPALPTRPNDIPLLPPPPPLLPLPAASPATRPKVIPWLLDPPGAAGRLEEDPIRCAGGGGIFEGGCGLEADPWALPPTSARGVDTSQGSRPAAGGTGKWCG